MKIAPETNAPAGERAVGVLVDPGWLEEHLDDPAVRVVEVDVSGFAHGQGHIDGAVLWDVYGDLKDADYRLAATPALEPLLVRAPSPPDSTGAPSEDAPALG